VVPEAIAALDRIALTAIQTALSERQNPAGRDPLGAGLAPYLEYALIPPFMRAVRNVAVVDDVAREIACSRIAIIGAGPLASAARHVAEARRIPAEHAGALPWQRLRQTLARLLAGRHVRWVGMEVRSLVLEPAFLLMLYGSGLWRRLTAPQPALSRNALIITGDRWTAAVVEHLGEASRTVILAGATQPGRARFRDASRFVPIESFARPLDVVKAMGAVAAAIPRTLAPTGEPGDAARFIVNGISFWPLVARSIRLHVVIWIPLLRHLRSLVRRVALACPQASLLTSADAPTYIGVLIAVARECGIPSTTIQHGLMGEPNGHSVVRADTMAAWGAATRPWHLQHAPQTARFVVTGYPPFDALAARRQASRPDSAGARASRFFTIVVCTSFISDFSVCAADSANLTMLEAVLDWARTRDDVRVVQKMHPGEEPAHYATAATALGWHADRFTMTNEPILYDLLESCDVLVTGYSSTALESVMLGTPAIVCDFVRRNLVDVGRVPGVTVVYSPADLDHELDRSRTAERPQRETLAGSPQLTEYISTVDGKAAERVAALVQGTGQ